jgi:hypothetical protein
VPTPVLIASPTTDLREPHHEVRAREQQRLGPERARHAQRDHEEGGHRGEHRQPDRPLLWIDDAGQPRVADPRPPHHAEHEHALGNALPRRVVGHQRRALRQREDENEVEEQLQRGDAGLLAQHRGQAVGTRRGCRGHLGIIA